MREPKFSWKSAYDRLLRAYRLEAPDPSQVPQVLESAHGLWAASLIDVCTVGFSLWTLLLAWTLGLGGRALWQEPTLIRVVLFAAALVGIVENEIAMDRLDTRVWILMAALLAASLRAVPRQARPPDRQSPHRPAGPLWTDQLDGTFVAPRPKPDVATVTVECEGWSTR